MPPSTASAHTPDYQRLGRLTSLGPKEPWQVALLLPERHDDCVNPVADASQLPEKGPMPIRLQIISPMTSSFRNGRPKVQFDVMDQSRGTYRATIFGDTKEWMDLLAGIQEATFMAVAKPWQDRLYLTIHELVDERWNGRIRPTYPAKRQVISPEKARETVIRLLPQAIPQAADFMQRQLEEIAPINELLTDCGARGWTLQQLIYQSHLPASVRHGTHAQAVMRRLAALCSLTRMHAQGQTRASNPVDMTGIEARIEQLPWPLTDDQKAAIREIAFRMGKKVPAHVIVAGDVGVGKTAVAAVLMATLASAPGNHRALFLSPNTPLAGQTYEEISAFFPDLSIALVTGSTPTSADLSASVLVGTSALLHRDLGERKFSLVVVDEQHRFSRQQREQHISAGTHLVELSATPIPRTQALVKYGRVGVIEMRQTAKPKTFITTLHQGRDGAKQLFNEITPVIRGGDPLLVVYPQRESAAGDHAPGSTVDPRHTVEMARERWEKMFPGQVLTLTSDDNDDRKKEVLDAIVKGKATVLLCTTVVETGINIPNLYHIAIVCPERHGLMTLHQLRGRTARKGGEGYCHLLCPDPLSEEQEEKLSMFCTTTDGFALAEYDLQRRGVGDLSPDSDKQSGADDTFLFGTKLDVALLDEVLPVWKRWTELGNGAS